MYLSLWSTVQVSVHAHGVQKRALDHLELQGFPTRALGTELLSSVRAIHSQLLNHLFSTYFFFEKLYEYMCGCMSVCLPCACRCLWKSQESEMPRTAVVGGHELSCECQKSNLVFFSNSKCSSPLSISPPPPPPLGCPDCLGATSPPPPPLGCPDCLGFFVIQSLRQSRLTVNSQFSCLYFPIAGKTGMHSTPVQSNSQDQTEYLFLKSTTYSTTHKTSF